MKEQEENMTDGTRQSIITLFIGLLCFALAVYNIRKESRRILNGILLFTALTFTFRSVMLLLFPDQEMSGYQLALGTGSELLFGLFLLALPASFLTGLLLVRNGIKVMAKEGRSLAHALPVIWGIYAILWPAMVVLAFAFIYLQSSSLVTMLVQITYELVLFIPRMLFVFMLYSFVYAWLPKNKQCDYILVLGAKIKTDGSVTPLLAKRLDKGIRLFRTAGQSAAFVVSGGQGDDESVSEAYAMKQYLLAQGIPEEKIIMEDQSVNTYQNMKFSRQVIESVKPDYSCLFVTNNYHVLRAAILARTAGLNAQGIGCRTALYYLPAAFIREHMAVIFKYRKVVLGYFALIIAYHLLPAMFTQF